jgi:iron complex transport system substrate-binding protein
MRKLPSLALLLLLLPAGHSTAQTPEHIVSMNVCTDQLLLLLVDKSRIASLSYFAADPTYSNLAEQTVGIASNRGQADAVLALQPDLILTSAFSGTFAASLLERLQQHVERLGFANNHAELYAQMAQVAAWTNSEPKAAHLIAQTQAAIATTTAQLRPLLRGQKALFVSSNGIAFGSGTLQHDFLQNLELRNVAAEAGLQGPMPLSLELLLQADADYIFTEPRGALDKQLAHPLLQHPALRKSNARVIALRDRWFDCAGPWLRDAYASLAQQVIGQEKAQEQVQQKAQKIESEVTP